MRALLAFDKFKDALTADAACAVAAEVLRARHPRWIIDSCPLTDGGEGFAEILTSSARGRMVPAAVTGPRGEPRTAAFGLASWSQVPAGARGQLGLPPETPPGTLVAIVEMAAASGLTLVPDAQRDPWQTTSQGAGEALRAAAAAGAGALLLGVGGSATNDLGLGALGALGLEFLSAQNEKISPPVPARWTEIARVAGALPPAFPPIRIACDVTNPLLGPRGCAAAYGPQKGLSEADRPRLEHASARLALMLCAHCGQPDALMDEPGAGAAGGIAFGLMAAARARILGGFDLVAAWLDLEARIAAADVVLTGEGRFDDSSLAGKGPAAVAARARAQGKTVHIFAGQFATRASPEDFVPHPITPAGQPLPQALRAAAPNLAAAVGRVF